MSNDITVGSNLPTASNSDSFRNMLQELLAESLDVAKLPPDTYQQPTALLEPNVLKAVKDFGSKLASASSAFDHNHTDDVVITVFTAQWCSPTHQIMGSILRLQEEGIIPANAILQQVDIDEHSADATKLHLIVQPIIIVQFVGGAVAVLMGTHSLAVLRRFFLSEGTDHPMPILACPPPLGFMS